MQLTTSCNGFKIKSYIKANGQRWSTVELPNGMVEQTLPDMAAAFDWAMQQGYKAKLATNQLFIDLVKVCKKGSDKLIIDDINESVPQYIADGLTEAEAIHHILLNYMMADIDE